MNGSRSLRRSWLVAVLAVLTVGLGGPAAADPPVESPPAEGAVEAPAAEAPAAAPAAARNPALNTQEFHPRGAGGPNVLAGFSPSISQPVIHQTAYLDPQSRVIGDVTIGSRVYVAPFASVRGDEGQPIYVGDEANVQDGAVVHALETMDRNRQWIVDNTVLVGGQRYGVYIANSVSLAHQAQVHGPAWIEQNTFVGMQVLVFRARIGANCILEPGAQVISREQGLIHIPAGRYVPAGTVITTQAQVNTLSFPIPSTGFYPFRGINAKVVAVNTALADGYNGKTP